MNGPSAISAKPVRIAIPIPGGDLAGWRWRNDGARPLLFCHATGFCASAYKQMLHKLCGRYDVYALDMRGHGRTRLPVNPAPLRSWNIYARDVAAFLDRESRDGWVLAGHSMGAVVVAMAARGRKDAAALKLIEPVAPPLYYTLAAHTPFWPLLSRRIPIARRAARRRAHWPGRDDVFKAYERKALFRDWAPGALADYLEDGLIADDRGVRLACDPSWEASTFAAQANDLWAAVRAAPAPISVFAAASRTSTVWPPARRRFRRAGADLAEIPGVSHLAPMEKPSLAADFIAKGVWNGENRAGEA